MHQVVVRGMSCSHCVGAVKSALEELNLADVAVSLETGLATFAEADLSPEVIAAAIDDAGFEVGGME